MEPPWFHLSKNDSVKANLSCQLLSQMKAHSLCIPCDPSAFWGVSLPQQSFLFIYLVCVRVCVHMSILTFQLSVGSGITFELLGLHNKHLYPQSRLVKRTGSSLHVFVIAECLYQASKTFSKTSFFMESVLFKNTSFSITASSTACGFGSHQFPETVAHKGASNGSSPGNVTSSSTSLVFVVCQSLLSFPITLRCLFPAFFPLCCSIFISLFSKSSLH